jgi:hypothetical protein
VAGWTPTHPVGNRHGELVLIPRERAMAAKVIPERA